MASSEEKAFWVPDEDTPSCQLCEVPFTLTRRRHHCRKCGSCVCGPCSRRKGGDGTRLCDECWSAGVESAHEQSAQAAWRESSEALRYRLRWTGSTVEATGAALLARVYALDGSSTTQAYDESTTARELARAAAAAFVGDDRSGAYGSLWTARRGDSLDALDFVDDDERVGDVLARFRVLGRARFAKLVVPVRPRHAALSVAPKRRDREKAADRHPALLKADAATRFAGRLAVERGGELDSSYAPGASARGFEVYAIVARRRPTRRVLLTRCGGLAAAPLPGDLAPRSESASDELDLERAARVVVGAAAASLVIVLRGGARVGLKAATDAEAAEDLADGLHAARARYRGAAGELDRVRATLNDLAASTLLADLVDADPDALALKFGEARDCGGDVQDACVRSGGGLTSLLRCSEGAEVVDGALAKLAFPRGVLDGRGGGGDDDDDASVRSGDGDYVMFEVEDDGRPKRFAHLSPDRPDGDEERWPVTDAATALARGVMGPELALPSPPQLFCGREEDPDELLARRDEPRTPPRRSLTTEDDDEILVVAETRDVFGRDVPGLDRLSPGRRLGRGAFSTVTVASDRATGKTYALKAVAKAEALRRDAAPALARERDALRLVAGDPFCLALHATFQDANFVYFLTALCEHDLMDAFMERGALDHDAARLAVACVALALCHCHDRDVVHRDLKPENVFVDDAGLAVLGDFGLAATLPYGTGLRLKTLCGTAEFLAPELLPPQRGYDHGVDWWALGVVAFEASHGYSPFAHPPAETEASIRDAAAGKFRNKIQKSFRDGDYHHGDFVHKCLAPAADRTTKADALDHAYFAGLDDFS
ncbi:serine/threonine kinase [Aureococcus anophagefferens]|nr:serine/threonine kinase [Aureococcus anophagefferens]